MSSAGFLGGPLDESEETPAVCFSVADFQGPPKDLGKLPGLLVPALRATFLILTKDLRAGRGHQAGYCVFCGQRGSVLKEMQKQADLASSELAIFLFWIATQYEASNAFC